MLISADYTPGPETPDEEYPFTAITGRLVYHWHTRTKTNKAPMLHEAAPDVFVSVNATTRLRLWSRTETSCVCGRGAGQ